MHFLEWKYMKIEKDFTEIKSLVCNWSYAIIGKGLEARWCQALPEPMKAEYYGAIQCEKAEMSWSSIALTYLFIKYWYQ